MTAQRPYDGDEVLVGALDARDQRTLALNLSFVARVPAKWFERMQAARHLLRTLERLNDQEPWVCANELWRHWHAEARRGYDEADERVIDLGG